MTPGWILDVLAALMLAVAAVSAARLVVAMPGGDRPVLAWPARPAGPGQPHADSDIGHLLMAIAMAGALAPSLATTANGAWAVVFAVLTAWFAGQAGRAVRTSGIRGLGGGQCAPSLVHAAAMLYMSLTVAGRTAAGPAMGGMGAGGAGGPGGGRPSLAYPTVAFALALILVGYAIWDLDQLSARRHRAAGPVAGRSSEALAGGSSAATAVAAVQAPPLQEAALRAALLSPALTVACRVVMGVTMAFMLVIML
jgi:hypothetical protein